MADESIMAREIALTVAALIIFFSASCGSSQPVPDGLVYTEIQKTLVQGIQGVLTCRFYGKPWVVYWDKGNDPDNLSPLLLWHVGAKSGPRYSDGSYDIDDNYSLIIKNVSTADAGRLYCTVSNYIGILIDNYTDVSIVDAAIGTNARVTLQMLQGTYGILQCTVHIKARRVSWRKGTSSLANESLVVIKNNQGVAEISGAGYKEGSYNITEDYSLVIKEVQVQHEGLYICEATDFDTGISFRNQSSVNVVVCAALILISSVAYFIWRKKHLNYSSVPQSAPYLELEDVDVENLTKEGWKALEDCVDSVLIKHYSRICDATKTNHFEAKQIISENITTLFDTHQMLTDWQKRQTSTSHQYIKAFQATSSEADKSGLLPPLRGPYIYKAELVDLAFHMLMHDLFPIAKELDINVTQLASYRPAFHTSHLEIGTFKLLTESIASFKGPLLPLRGDNKRTSFFRMILDLHYKSVSITGHFEYDMSYGELCSISEAINQSAGRRSDQVTSGMLPDKLGNLQDGLQLTDQDLADRLDTSIPLTAYALFKTWKEKSSPSVFNYHAALAHELRKIEMPDLADEILAGKYITGKTSLAFIEDMVQGLNQDQIGSLGELLQLSRGKEQWHTTTPFNEISKQIYDWVEKWTKEMKNSSKALFVKTLPKKKHRDLNDRLVEHGFLALAREIMIIEQQLAWL